MPTKYNNKYSYNKSFLQSLHNDYAEDFFDWKVTAQFYTGLHKCYCVLLSKGLNVEERHSLNIKNLRTIDVDLAESLYKLFKNSKQSRYDGFINEDSMLRINKINFKDGNGYLNKIESNSVKYYPVVV